MKIKATKVHIFESGIQTEVSTTRHSSPPKNIKRGKVSNWSKASRARLREFLLTHSAPGVPIAITLTVPGSILSVEEWATFVKPFWLKIAKLQYPCVWRIELQQRKQPHYHVVLWGEMDMAFRIQQEWFNAIGRLSPIEYTYSTGLVYTGDRLGMYGAIEHSVQISACGDNFERWWRYLCDHASKRKQAQLGWQGRHWGVVYRKGFQSLVPVSECLSERQWFKFIRVLRRLTRASVFRGSIGKSVWFSSPSTVKRIVEWVKQ